MRVGWLGIGVSLFVSTAASAGPSFARFDESGPVASTPLVLSSESAVVRASSDSGPAESAVLEPFEELPTVWHALPEPTFSFTPVDADAPLTAAALRIQPVSVPLQFGWIGVLAVTTVGSYLGARWIGIRRNHNR
jgi:hypothetical protein